MNVDGFDLAAIPRAIADNMRRRGMALSDDQYAALLVYMAGVQITIQTHGVEKAAAIYAAEGNQNAAT